MEVIEKEKNLSRQYIRNERPLLVNSLLRTFGNNMSSSIILPILCASALLSSAFAGNATEDTFLQKLKDARLACIEKKALDPELAKEIMARGKKQYTGDDPKVKCFGACLLEELGFVIKDGKFDKEVELSELMKSRKAEYQHCLNETGTDNCDAAHKFLICRQRGT